MDATSSDQQTDRLSSENVKTLEEFANSYRSGLDLLRELREQNVHIPVIIMAQESAAEDRALLDNLLAEVGTVLTKPSYGKDFYRAVAKAIVNASAAKSQRDEIDLLYGRMHQLLEARDEAVHDGQARYWSSMESPQEAQRRLRRRLLADVSSLVLPSLAGGAFLGQAVFPGPGAVVGAVAGGVVAAVAAVEGQRRWPRLAGGLR
jgi:CheY-like chemotaxis protein